MEAGLHVLASSTATTVINAALPSTGALHHSLTPSAWGHMSAGRLGSAVVTEAGKHETYGVGADLVDSMPVGSHPRVEGVDGAKAQTGEHERGHVGTDCANRLGTFEHLCELEIESAPPLEGRPLDIGVPSHADQKRNKRQSSPIGHVLDDQLDQSAHRRPWLSFIARCGETLIETSEGALEPQLQQLLLALDMVIQRALRESGGGRNMPDAGSVVAPFEELVRSRKQH